MVIDDIKIVYTHECLNYAACNYARKYLGQLRYIMRLLTVKHRKNNVYYYTYLIFYQINL